MTTVTVAELRVRCDEKADMVNSNFIGAAEQLRLINVAYRKFYDIITSSFEDYNLGEPTTFTIAPGASTFTLPSDFYKLAGVDRSNDLGANPTRYYPLRNTPWRSRNRYQTSFSTQGRGPRVGYRMTGNLLRLTPIEQAPGQYRIWYYPFAEKLIEEADTIEGYNGFEELVVIDVALNMVNKEESDLSLLLLERREQQERMQNLLVDRDINDGERIEEVDRGQFDEDGYYND